MSKKRTTNFAAFSTYVIEKSGRFPQLVLSRSEFDAHVRRAENAALERAARIAEQPYNEKVQALGNESPLTVAHKISDAIRRLRTRAPRRPKGAT